MLNCLEMAWSRKCQSAVMGVFIWRMRVWYKPCKHYSSQIDNPKVVISVLGTSIRNSPDQVSPVVEEIAPWSSSFETWGRKRVCCPSARVVDAYQTLSKPLARAIYVLKLEGVDVDEEQTTAFYQKKVFPRWSQKLLLMVRLYKLPFFLALKVQVWDNPSGRHGFLC